MNKEKTIAPGARVVIRDAEWLVRKVERTSNGGSALTVIGIAELVQDKETLFLDKIDRDIEMLNPVGTKLVSDFSPSCKQSLLYMESLLWQTPPTNERTTVRHFDRTRIPRQRSLSKF